MTMEAVIPRDVQAVRQLSGSLELVAQEPLELAAQVTQGWIHAGGTGQVVPEIPY